MIFIIFFLAIFSYKSSTIRKVGQRQHLPGHVIRKKKETKQTLNDNLFILNEFVQHPLLFVFVKKKKKTFHCIDVDSREQRTSA